ncbi:rhodanese-like domain-containing protein [filamentous cyanobacterium CCP5]|nr:rhodanese-like domain-containing protein [filamentous cyanobacterium CCP5]
MGWAAFFTKPLRSLAWGWVKRLVQKQFPGVASLSTADLAQQLAHGDPPLLIDVRGEEEYAVSHLPGALHLPSEAAIAQADIPPDTPLVLYCSIGYRSARLAEKLQETGYSKVKNLEGSIFEWYNQGRPVVANGEPVQRVHPYSFTWGLLLEEGQ